MLKIWKIEEIEATTTRFMPFQPLFTHLLLLDSYSEVKQDIDTFKIVRFTFFRSCSFVLPS